jgi:streptomycin 6-kinase
MLLDGPARARLADRFGAGVSHWCDELPALVETLAKRWGLEILSAMPGNTGRTLMCRDAAGRSAVLKVTPGLDIAATEAAALRAWRGCSRVVQLLDADYDAGAVLLEGVVPGTPLAAATGEVPLDQIAELLTELHSVPGADDIPTVAERVTGFFDLAERRWRGSSAEQHLPLEVLRRSRAAATELAGGGRASLVHGDLHPGNVLRGAQGIVAIDPRPCVGDETFDAVDWAFLPVARGGRLDDGIAALAERLPGLDTDRLRGWCEAFAVLVALGPLMREGPTPYTDAVLQMAP